MSLLIKEFSVFLDRKTPRKKRSMTEKCEKIRGRNSGKRLISQRKRCKKKEKDRKADFKILA